MPPSGSNAPEPAPGAEPDAPSSPPPRSRARRARSWFRGLSESGKVTLVAAVITTLGAVVSAFISAAASGGQDGSSAGQHASPGPGASSPGQKEPDGTAGGGGDGAPGPSPTGTTCRNVADRWIKSGQVAAETRFDSERESVDFADLDGNGRDDYLMTDTTTGTVRAWLNHDRNDNGQLEWKLHEDFAPGRIQDKNRETVDFADLDGDGRDDYLVVDSTSGAVRVWRNEEGDSEGRPDWPSWGKVAGPGRIGEFDFADLDGDGRDDYLTADGATGKAHYRLNRPGPDGRPAWQPRRPLSPGAPQDGTGTDVSYQRVDCDKRADYLRADQKTGEVWAQLNGDGPGGRPAWRKERRISSGVGHDSTRQNIAFADLDGDGRDDYLLVDHATGATDAWINKGGDPG